MQREEQLARLGEQYDVLVIGGGATGLGVAVDAASRGYRTVLVEARDFAQGTSSRSTKLVHGGVRYLQQRNIRLVREALHERGRLLRNAPHLVHELRFLVPAYRRWDQVYYGTGLFIYDRLAGKLGLTPSRVVGAGTAQRLVPTIRRQGLVGGIVYSDAQFNDARLAIILARTAAQHGATLVNYARVTRLLHEGGRIAGAVVEDVESGREHEVRARAVVNATGVFSDAIRRLDDPSAEPVIAPSQGIHVVLDRGFLPGDTALLVPKTEDGRVVFVIPWQGRTLAGTTDTPVDAPDPEPTPREDELDFVLRHVGMYIEREPSRADVLSVFAGLRPLVRPRGGDATSTAAIGRDHSIFVSSSGMVTITGGKWTTYRRMAEDAVDRVAEVAGLPQRASQTAELRLAGIDGDPRWAEFGVPSAEVDRYEAEYHGDLHPRLPYSLAMAAWAAKHEMVVHLEDLLARRLRALLLDARAAIEAAPRAAELLAHVHGRDDAWVAREVAAFCDLAETHYLPRAERPQPAAV